jgi:hypothetical protein
MKEDWLLDILGHMLAAPNPFFKGIDGSRLTLLDSLLSPSSVPIARVYRSMDLGCGR